MKISELIEKLSDFNQDAEVELFDSCSGEFFPPDEISGQRYDKAVLVFNG